MFSWERAQDSARVESSAWCTPTTRFVLYCCVGGADCAHTAGILDDEVEATHPFLQVEGNLEFEPTNDCFN